MLADLASARRVLQGLAKAPELNDVVVRQVGPEEDDGRIPVVVDQGIQVPLEHCRSKLRVRPTNLRPLELADAAAALGYESQGTGFSDSDDDDDGDGDGRLHPMVGKLLARLERRCSSREVQTELDHVIPHAVLSPTVRKVWEARDVAAAMSVCLLQLDRRTGRTYLQECAGYRGDQQLISMYVIQPLPSISLQQYAPRMAGMGFDKALRASAVLALAVGDDAQGKADIVKLLTERAGGRAMQALLRAAAPLGRLPGMPPAVSASAAGLHPEGWAFCDGGLPMNSWKILAILSSGGVPGTAAAPSTLRTLLEAGVGLAVRRRLSWMEEDGEYGHANGQSEEELDPFQAHFAGMGIQLARKATRAMASQADREPLDEAIAEQETGDAYMLQTLANLCTIPEGAAILMSPKEDAEDAEVRGCSYIGLGNYLLARGELVDGEFEQSSLRQEGVQLSEVQADAFLFNNSFDCAPTRHRKSETGVLKIFCAPRGDQAARPTVVHCMLPPMITCHLAMARTVAAYHSHTKPGGAPSPAIAQALQDGIDWFASVGQEKDFNSAFDKFNPEMTPGSLANVCCSLPVLGNEDVCLQEFAEAAFGAGDPDPSALRAWVQEKEVHTEQVVCWCSAVIAFLECGLATIPEGSPGKKAAQAAAKEAKKWDWGGERFWDSIKDHLDARCRGGAEEWRARLLALRASALLLCIDAHTPRKGLGEPAEGEPGGEQVTPPPPPGAEKKARHTRGSFVTQAVDDATSAASCARSAQLQGWLKGLLEQASAVAAEADAGGRPRWGKADADAGALAGSEEDMEDEDEDEDEESDQGSDDGGAAVLGCTKLHTAAMQGNVDKVKKLLKRPASERGDVNARNSMQETALMMAACYGGADCIRALAAAGADPTVADWSGETALSRAEHAFGGNEEETVRAVQEAIANWDPRNAVPNPMEGSVPFPPGGMPFPPGGMPFPPGFPPMGGGGPGGCPTQ